MLTCTCCVLSMAILNMFVIGLYVMEESSRVCAIEVPIVGGTGKGRTITVDFQN